MPTFTYTAIDTVTGRESGGTLDGATLDQAIAALRQRGLAPIALQPVESRVAGATQARATPTAIAGSRAVVSPEKERSFLAKARSFNKGKASRARVTNRKLLTLFTRQLATLVKAGMPLLRCLQVLARQEKRAPFRAALERLEETIRSGGTLSDGLMLYPKDFDRLYVNMVKAGEAGGVLDTVLGRLALFLEKAERIKAKIKSAMTYPVIVVLLALGIVAALMVVVVPKFEQIFSGLLKGQPLPTLTRGVLGLSYFVQRHVFATMAIAVATYVIITAIRKTTKGIRVLDWLALKAPVIGDLFAKAAIARFTRTFGTLLASGVPILQALLITRDTSGNVHIAGAIQRVHERVKAGDSVARPLQETAIFPPMVSSMIEVGEETGALSEMLVRIADTYDEEVDEAVNGLTSVIEPFMIVFLALMVGTIVIALFLPIVSIIQHLQ
jgi:type IV pilus assembly protein PilC